MKLYSRTQKLGLVAAFIGLQLSSVAVAEENGERRKARRGPPPEAVDACSNAQEGAGCSFIGRRDDTVSGTCEFMRDDFVCVPEGHRERGERTQEPPA
jgi:hypothetical protein